jgi:hypothetical protein
MNWPFKDWGASAVLAGHDHIYERVHTNGLVYFVNGLGGDSRDQFHYPLVAGSQRQFSADFGAMHVRATETNIVFRFITQRNNLIDEYWMHAPAKRKRVRLRFIRREVEPRANFQAASERGSPTQGPKPRVPEFLVALG